MQTLLLTCFAPEHYIKHSHGPAVNNNLHVFTAGHYIHTLYLFVFSLQASACNEVGAMPLQTKTVILIIFVLLF